MSGPCLFEVYLRLGRDYNLPIFIARDWFAKFAYLQRSLTSRDVVIDHTVTIGVETPPQEWSMYYRSAIESLQPGITQFVIHPGIDNAELQAVFCRTPIVGRGMATAGFRFLHQRAISGPAGVS